MWGFALQALGAVPPTAIALALTMTGVSAGASPVTSPAEQISASASATELTIGATLAVAGAVTIDGHGVAGAPLALQSEAYPFRGFSTTAHVTSGPDGSFSFRGVLLERNSRLRVVADGASTPSSRQLRVFVYPAVAISARRLGPGATRLSMRIRHAVEAGSPSVSALWFTAPRGTLLFRLAAVTPTREIAPGVSYASTVVNPPATRFAYRVCLNPAWERAMGRSAGHG
ncbi:MAG: hypothetical protein JWL67_2365, partial [Solirubrobacterales bacterium]|nr:hypothetical protein [Solirubrobacterales bacterium]